MNFVTKKKKQKTPNKKNPTALKYKCWLLKSKANKNDPEDNIP